MLADAIYQGGSEFKVSDLVPLDMSGLSEEAWNQVLITRQALHAFRLEITHPESGKRMQFEAPLPEDFMNTLEALRKYRSRK